MDDGDQVIPELLPAAVRRTAQGGAAGGVNDVQKGRRPGRLGGRRRFRTLHALSCPREWRSPPCSPPRPLREPLRFRKARTASPPRSRLESRLGFVAWNKERPPWNERFSWRGLGALPGSPTSSHH